MSEKITKNPLNISKYLPLPESIKRLVNNRLNGILNPALMTPLLNGVDYSIKHSKVCDKLVSFFFLESLPSSIYQEFMFNLCNQEGISACSNQGCATHWDS